MREKRKILIVDDSEMNRLLLSDMLSSEFDIIEAENGMEAAAILHNQEHEISLMLLDIVMPIMDGFEMLAVMNKNGWIKSVPVIMISAETVPSYMDKAYDLGVLDYISRPFDERVVQRRVTSTIMLAAKQKELAHMVTEQLYEKEKDNRLMIEILSNIVEFRNGESGLHVLHIHTLTELLLKKLIEKTDKYNISKKDIPLICNASALHDIGKIAVPGEILNKPGRLTKEEFEIMKTHSAAGAKMLSCIPLRENEPLIQVGYQICRWHHERYDGKGYPDGLKGEEIPIAAQVVALADVYDALTSKRVYKDAFSHEVAVNMILNGECGVFNPILMECLTEISEVLKKELNETSIGSHFEKDLMGTIEQQMMDMKELNVSERTIHLLEHERMKYQFFANTSKEIQFEYTTTPEMLMLSQWGADYLRLPEMILNPKESAFGNQIFFEDDFEQLLNKLKNTTPEDSVIKETYLLNINGSQRWSEVIAKSMWTNEQPPKYEGAIGKIVDIHEYLEKMNRLELAMAQDSLTGLLNHAVAKSRLSALLSAKENKKYILLLIDVDDFRKANDKYGHQSGDEILKYVADTIKNSIRSADIAARMGGDEFLIFMEYKDTTKPQVERIFKQLHGEYKEFPIHVSIGIASSEDCKQRDYNTLFQMADKALYTAKHKGGHNYQYYDETIETIWSTQISEQHNRNNQ